MLIAFGTVNGLLHGVSISKIKWVQVILEDFSASSLSMQSSRYVTWYVFDKNQQ